jgi:hypothetical protein
LIHAVKLWWRKLDTRQQRFLAEIETARLGRLARTPVDAKGQKQLEERNKAFEDLLAKAQGLWTESPQVAWATLQAARHLEIPFLPRDALNARAEVLRGEAEAKLRGWRREAVRTLLSSDPGPGSSSTPVQPQNDDLPCRVLTAAQLIDEHFANMYFKHEIVLRHAFILLVQLLVGLGVVIAVFLPFAWLSLRTTSYDPKDFRLIPYVALMGAIGACFSGLRSLFGAASDKIPQVVLSTKFTVIRPSIGAIAAVVVYLAQVAGIITFGTASVAAILTSAFVAGLSDALIVRVAGTFENGSSR